MYRLENVVRHWTATATLLVAYGVVLTVASGFFRTGMAQPTWLAWRNVTQKRLPVPIAHAKFALRPLIQVFAARIVYFVLHIRRAPIISAEDVTQIATALTVFVVLMADVMEI
jgi:hypothetical protein